MRLINFLVPMVAGVIIPSVACHRQKESKSPEPQVIQELRWLDGANPVADAKAALAKGDHRLRAVHGLTTIIPGTDRKDFSSLEKKYGINPISGTTDGLLNDEHGGLVLLAAEYAEKYNRYIINEYKTESRP